VNIVQVVLDLCGVWVGLGKSTSTLFFLKIGLTPMIFQAGHSVPLVWLQVPLCIHLSIQFGFSWGGHQTNHTS